MKKLYTDKIKQYTLDGILLNTFNNKQEVNDSTGIHQDSIISCCKGKYKTSGGFIFRFENDPLNLNIENKIKVNKNIHICKICNSEETTRSLAMHLKFNHNLKTDDYIKQYGEFRSKQIKYENGLFQCNICNMKLNSNQHLMYHLTKEHKEITQSEYIIENFYNNENPLCKCGCGEKVTLLRNGKNCDLNKETYNRDYIKGHWDWEVFSGIGKQSKEEIELLDFIKSIYDGKIKESVRGIIHKAEIDIYLPELNIGIEYNGLYWHSEKGGRFKDYHINKTLKAKKNNIRLIQIFSDEWLNKKELVKSKLKSILNKSDNGRIFARKCIIKEITVKEKGIFLDKNHIQGRDRSKINLGLYNNDILIGVMTFSSPRMVLGGKNKEGYYELSRYSTSTNIIGGSSKLIQYFIKNYNPTQIYSYSDNRWSDWDNNMYTKIGFIKESISKPGYFYTKNYLERIHRFNFSKQNLKKKGINIEGKTEKQIMEDLKYTRVWDCGVTKFVMNF